MKLVYSKCCYGPVKESPTEPKRFNICATCGKPCEVGSGEPTVSGIDTRGKSFTLGVTLPALQFFAMVPPGNLPERCPGCLYQSMMQGQTFQFTTITVQEGQIQKQMVNGLECQKCHRKLTVEDCTPLIIGEDNG